MESVLRVGLDNRQAVGSARVLTGALGDVKKSAIGMVGAIGAIVGITSALAVVRRAVDTYRSLETALIQVGKTSGMAGKELAQFGLDVQNLARRLPVAQVELLGISAVAAQLGVSGTSNLLKFAETVAKLGRTSNLSGEAAATALARMLNVTHDGMENVDRLASTILRLGYTSTATESDIADMGTEIAKASALYGVNSAEASAFAAALKDVGAEAELSSSVFFQTMSLMDSASRKGGAGMAILQKITGETGETFRKQFKENAADAMVVFLEGIKRMKAEGHDVAAVMEEFGLQGLRAGKVLPPLSLNVEALTKYLAAARDEWQKNTAMNKAFSAQLVTVNSAMQLLGNSFEIFFQEMGRGMAQGLNEFAGAIRDVLANSEGAGVAIGRSLGTALVELGKALKFVNENATLFKGLLISLAAYKAISFLGSITTLVAGTKYLSDSVQLIRAFRGEGAKVVALEIGQKLATGFKLALSPLGAVNVVLLVIAGTILLVTNHLNRLYDQFMRDMQRTQQFAAEVMRLRGLLSQAGPGNVRKADVDSAQAVLEKMKKDAEATRATIARLKEDIASSSAAGNLLSGRSGRLTDLAGDPMQKNSGVLAAQNALIAQQQRLVDGLSTSYEAAGGAAGEALRTNIEAPTEDAIDVTKEHAEAVKQLKVQLKAQADILTATQKIVDKTPGGFAKAEAAIAAVTTVISAGIDPATAEGKALYEMALAVEKTRVALDRSKGAYADFWANVEKGNSESKVAHEAWLQEQRDKAYASGKMVVEALKVQALSRQEVDDAAAEVEARKKGTSALEELNIQLEIRNRLMALDPALKKTNPDLYKQTAAEIEADVRRMAEIRKHSEASAKAWEKAAGFMGILSTIAGAVGGKFAALVGFAQQFASAMQAAAEAQKSGDKMGAAMAGMQAGQAIFGAGKTFGLWKGLGGTGSLGGKMSGDYAEIGAMIGGLFGPVWAVVGAVIGSAIKSGADQALGKIRMSAGEAAISLGAGSAGGLSGIITDMGHKVIASLKEIVAAMGGELKAIPDVDFKIRDDVISVFVNGWVKKFKDVDQAIQFAITEILRTAQFTGVDKMITDALKGGAGGAGSMEELQANLQAVVKVMEFGMTASEKTIGAFTAELDGLRQKMIDLLGSSDQLARALANIGQEEIRRWQDSRNAITGDKMSNAEKLQLLKADAQMWNAQKALRIAELTLKRDALGAEIKIVQAGGTLNSAHLIGQANYLKTKAELYNDDLHLQEDHLEGLHALDEAALAQLKTMFDAIDLVITALQNMPDIDIPHLHLPGGGGGGNVGNVNTGPTEAERLAAFNEQLQALRDEQLPAGERELKAIRDQFEALRVTAVDLGLSVEELNAIEQQRLHTLGEQAVDSLGLASEQLRDKYAQIAETLAFLRDNMDALGISTERYAQITAELGTQLYTDLMGGLMQFIDDEDVRNELEQARFDMQIAQYHLEFELLRAQGLLTEAQIAAIEHAFSLIPDDIPKGGFGQHNQGGGGDTGGGNNVMEERARLLQSVMDRLERWNDLKLSAADRELKAINKEFEQLQIDAQKAGVSLDLVRQAYNAAIEDFWDRMLTPLKDFLDQLNGSEMSSLTPEQRLQAAQARFDEVAARARAGDLEAIQLLPGVAQDLLDQARSFFAGSEGFAAILQTVQAVIEQILGQHGIVQIPPPVAGTDHGTVTHNNGHRFQTIGEDTGQTIASGTAGLEQRMAQVVREQAATRIQASTDNEALRREVQELNAKVERLTENIARLTSAMEPGRSTAWGGN